LSRCLDDRIRFAGGFGLDCSTALEDTSSLPAVPCSAPAPEISADVPIIVAVRFRLGILIDVDRCINRGVGTIFLRDDAFDTLMPDAR
jgi:hypothetical protein